jgi:iron-sulfur-dependent L-serine dehydratase beta subunit
MNVFDIIGPVMIGPSSSHTAGAVRLGRVANKLIDNRKLRKVDKHLSGLLPQTYRARHDRRCWRAYGPITAFPRRSGSPDIAGFGHRF